MQLTHTLESYINKRGPTVLMGDFNCPDIDWVTMTSSSDQCHLILRDFVSFNGFTQCVTGPTRLQNLLDLVLTNDPFIVSSIETTSPFSTSDHNSIDVDIVASRVVRKLCDNSPPSMQKKYAWASGDYAGMCNYLASVDWNSIFMYNLTPDDLWCAFCDVLDNAINLFVPFTEFNTRDKTNLWQRKYPRHIKNLISRKRCVWRQLRKFPANQVLAERYKVISSECKVAIKKYELNSENKVIEAQCSGEFFYIYQ